MKLNKSEPNKLYQQLIADGEIMRVDLSLVDRDENQPRSKEQVMLAAKDLQPSIKINGIVQMPVYMAKPDGRFLIVVGECRTEGARLNGHTEIAAVIKTCTNTNEEKKQTSEIRYAENDPKTRKSLTPLDESKFWFDYISEFYTDETGKHQVKKAAEHLGQDQSKISQFLGIHKASDSVKSLIKKHKIVDYQLAYIMARMDKYKGLVSDFVGRIENADLKGGVQVLANKMLKEAKDIEHEKKQEDTTLDLPPRTANQSAKQREKELQTDTAERELKEQLQKQDRKNKFNNLESEETENSEATVMDSEILIHKGNAVKSTDSENQQGQPDSTKEPEESNDSEIPSNTGTVLLKCNKNTVILSTIANQPAVLNVNQAKSLIAELNNWIKDNE